MVPIRSKMLGNMFLRYFGLTKIPVLGFVRPRVVEWTEENIVIKIPFTRRNKNHLGSMYFAVLAVGADLAGGFFALVEGRKKAANVALIFKNMHADFLKRAEGDTFFTCTQGQEIKALVAKAVATGERVEMPVTVVATCPGELGAEPVAKFTLTLSMKKLPPKAATP